MPDMTIGQKVFSVVSLLAERSDLSSTLTPVYSGGWQPDVALTQSQMDSFLSLDASSADNGYAVLVSEDSSDVWHLFVGSHDAASLTVSADGGSLLFNTGDGASILGLSQGDQVAHRALSHYVLGSQSDKPLQPAYSSAQTPQGGGQTGMLSVQTGLTDSVYVSTDYQVYRVSPTPEGSVVTIPTPSVLSIPASQSYYCFELEVHVDATCTTLVGPTGWTWLEYAGLPDAVQAAGKTIYVSCRLDCQSGDVLASVWRVA